MSENTLKTLEDLEELRIKYHQAHAEYFLDLGNLFHHKSAVELAKLSINPGWTQFVDDYVNHACTPKFKQEYKENRGIQMLIELATNLRDSSRPLTVKGFHQSPGDL